MPTTAGMVLIGGGSASASAAAELRRLGYDGPVTLLEGWDVTLPPSLRAL